MENDYKRLYEILGEAIGRARSEARDVLDRYSIVRLHNINNAIVDKVDEVLTKSPEKLKALTESIIPKLEKLLKLTGPNKVDDEILEFIADRIKYSINCR
jgi:DNA polymerase/3'-5' exonuclease PolX